MTGRREAPYLWSSWLTELLVGDQACEWSVWFRAHHNGFAQVPSDFDQAAWMIKHTELRRSTSRQLRDEGFEVSVEDQNDWRLADPKYGITLAAKPDTVAAKEALVPQAHGSQRPRRPWLTDGKAGPLQNEEVGALSARPASHRCSLAF